MEYYKLNSETKNIILELKKKAQELQLGNISFEYYLDGDTINFYITEYRTYWEAVVRLKKKASYKIYWELTDIYKICDNELKYENGERDLL